MNPLTSDLRRFLLVLRLVGRDLLEHLSIFSLGNLVVAFSLLIPPLLPLALAGLWRVAARVAAGEDVGWETLWDGATRRIGRTFSLTLATLLGYLLCVMNLHFYAQPDAPLPFVTDARLRFLLLLFWGIAALLWTIFWLYVSGCLVLEEASVSRAVHCALHLMRERTLFTFLFGLLLLAFALITAYVPALVVLLFWAWLALLAVRSVQVLLHDTPAQ